jgi:hypothetical protein
MGASCGVAGGGSSSAEEVSALRAELEEMRKKVAVLEDEGQRNPSTTIPTVTVIAEAVSPFPTPSSPELVQEKEVEEEEEEEVVDPEPDRCCAPPLLFWPSPEYQDEIDGGFIRVRSLGLGLGAEYGSFNDTSRLFRCNGFPIKQIINSIAGSSLESFGKRDLLDKVRTASEINENFLRANLCLKGLKSGTSIRVQNSRTGDVTAVLLFEWSSNQSDQTNMLGCFNPFEYCSEGSFQVGDELLLLDLDTDIRDSIAKCGGHAVVPLKYKLGKGITTGWNVPCDELKFGGAGIVGGWWKDLVVEIVLENTQSICGVLSDSINLPFSLAIRGGGGGGGGNGASAKDIDMDMDEWREVAQGLKGTFNQLPEPISAKEVRLTWLSTDMHLSVGLSTYRGGGGFHAAIFVN